MLSVSKIKNSKGASHYFAKDDYYAKDDPNHQQLSGWYGKGAQILNLSGEVNPKIFEKILAGNLPNGKQIGLIKDGDFIHDSGRDLTFSAPKSVSIMALIYDDKRLLEAHNLAVKSTLDEIEKNYLKTRIKQDGITNTITTNNLIAATFEHHTSRNLDPQLHTHCVIANATRDDNDKWKSAFFDDIYDNKKLLGAIYRSELAYQIKQLGYEITTKGNDAVFELKNVNPELLDIFSTRSKEIKQKAGENASQKQLEKAALITRSKKQEPENLKEIWQEKLDNFYHQQKLSHQIIPPQPNPIFPDQQKSNNEIAKEVVAKEAVNYAILHLSERKTIFSKQELIITALNDKLSQVRLEDINQQINHLIQKKELLPSKHHKLPDSFTTQSLLNQELNIIKIMQDGKNQHQPIINDFDKYSALLTNLNAGQKQSAQLILTSKDRVIGIQGYAGVGKTFMLKCANQIIKKQDYNFIGLSPTGVATKNLEQESGIKSITLQKFLNQYDGVAKGRGTTHGREIMAREFRDKIVIVDEASMISNHQMQNLLTISKALDFRLVLVGDKNQLPAVEAGIPFALLQKNGMPTAQMTEIIRQNNSNLKSAVYNAINYDIAKAFDKIDVNIKETREEIISKVVKEFMLLSEAQRKSTLIIAPANEDRIKINQMISDSLNQARINQQPHTIYENTNLTEQQKTRTGHFEKGNILLFNKNRDYLNIKKNDYCQIINIEAKTNQLIVKNLSTKKLTAFNPKQIKGKADKIYFEVFAKKSRNFKEGDKIAFSRSIEDLKILNSSQGTINHLDNNQISITLEDGRKINLNHNSNASKHLDHSYAITTHKAQGLTCNNVIAIVDSTRKNLTNQKNFYVEISRAKERAIIITDDKTKSINQIKKETGFDLSAKEHQNLKDHQQKINQHHQISRQQNHHQPKQPQIHHQPQPTHQSKGMDFSR
jgi:conjugative relaxase-like TrwC/TraI family protein